MFGGIERGEDYQPRRINVKRVRLFIARGQESGKPARTLGTAVRLRVNRWFNQMGGIGAKALALNRVCSRGIDRLWLRLGADIFGKVAAFGKTYRHPAPCRIARDSGADKAAADHQQINVLWAFDVHSV